MDVSIIIVNYNTKQLLKNCLQSIYAKTKDVSFEVIVSDNGSVDGSVEMLRKDFTQVKLVENKANLGFGAGNNRGLAVAKGKYVFYLNSDTVLLNNAIKCFFDYFEQNGEKESIGALGANLLNENMQTIHSYGKFITKKLFIDELAHTLYGITKLTILSLLFKKNKTKTYFDSIRQFYIGEVDYITGADLFVRNDENAKFDERYFMYVEEVDLQYNLAKLGKKRLLIGGPLIQHFQGSSSKKIQDLIHIQGSFSHIYNNVSRTYFLQKNNCDFMSLLFIRLLIVLIWLNPFIVKSTAGHIRELFAADNSRARKAKPSFDIYIISSVNDLDNIERNVSFIKKNIKANDIYVVTKKVGAAVKKSLPMCTFIDENSIIKGLDFDSVREELAKYSPVSKNTGWYFQQFLKYACAYICKNPYYLVWDADTIPLRNIDFFDKKGRPFFNLKREYVDYYFYTIKNLFGYDKKTKESFISEHMLFDRDIVKEMCQSIAAGDSFPKKLFWKKILNASFDFARCHESAQRNFSEYETYGVYCDYKYPKRYAKRKLATLRYGSEYLGDNPSAEVFEWAAKDFDTISFERYEKNKKVDCIIQKTKDPIIRRKKSFRGLLLKYQRCYKNQLRLALFTFNKKKIKDLQKSQNYFKYDYVFGTKLDYNPLRSYFAGVKQKHLLWLKNNLIFMSIYKNLKNIYKILTGQYL